MMSVSTWSFVVDSLARNGLSMLSIESIAAGAHEPAARHDGQQSSSLLLGAGLS
jgi:hypothetical protein